MCVCVCVYAHELFGLWGLYVAFEGYIIFWHVHGINLSSHIILMVQSVTPLHFHVEMIVKRYYDFWFQCLYQF